MDGFGWGGLEPIGEPSAEPIVDSWVEPAVEPPLIEEPLIEEPLVEEPLVEEPIIEEPLIEEPLAEEPLVEEPIIEEQGLNSTDESNEPLEELDPFWVEIAPDELQDKTGKETLWSDLPFERGRNYEKFRDANLASNCPTIDDVNEDNDIVTSMKTLDLRADTYQDASKLESKVKSYVDDLSVFPGMTWNNLDIQESEIQERYLELGIPSGAATADQRERLHDLQEYANNKNVTLTVFEVP